MKIASDFWQNHDSLLLLNPKLSMVDQKHIKRAIDMNFKGGVVWLKSSGTESAKKAIKLVEIKKSAILNAAASFNKHYQVSHNDIWLNPLPQFHIGGLAIGTRCFLAQAKEVLFGGWSPQEFHTEILNSNATLSSLVPTQVYDLVQANLQAPKTLRMILLGGGAMTPSLYQQARKLGWPLIPSYGMTESCAIIAGAQLSSLNSNDFPAMKSLNHLRLQPIGEGFALESTALFSSYLWVYADGEVEIEPRPEPFVLDDQLVVKDSFVKVLGRDSELVKILGETVNLTEVAHKVAELVNKPFILVPEPDVRRSYCLKLLIEDTTDDYDLEKINEALMPFEMIDQIKILHQFPRSELGKILRSQLIKDHM